MALSGKCGRGAPPSLDDGCEGFNLRFEVGRDSDIGVAPVTWDGHKQESFARMANKGGTSASKQALAKVITVGEVFPPRRAENSDDSSA